MILITKEVRLPLRYVSMIITCQGGETRTPGLSDPNRAVCH